MEAIESIVMQLFLLEVRKRCFAPSIIWLHDGFWIDKHVDNEVLFAAEKHVKTLLFPTYDVHSPLFHVTDLTEVRNQALASCPPLPCLPFISCPDDIAIAELGTKTNGGINGECQDTLPALKSALDILGSDS